MADTTEVDVQIRSGVKIEQNSKGFAQTKVSVYAGETTESMQKIIDIAVEAYETLLRRLGDKAQQ